MSETPKCTSCGVDLPPDAPEGLCPACLLKRGMESSSADPNVETVGVGEPVGEVRPDTPTLPADEPSSEHSAIPTDTTPTLEDPFRSKILVFIIYYLASLSCFISGAFNAKDLNPSG